MVASEFFGVDRGFLATTLDQFQLLLQVVIRHPLVHQRVARVHNWITIHGFKQALLFVSVVATIRIRRKLDALLCVVETRRHWHVLLLVILHVHSRVFLIHLLPVTIISQFTVNLLVGEFKSFVKHVSRGLSQFFVDIVILSTRIIQDGFKGTGLSLNHELLLALTRLLIVHLYDSGAHHFRLYHLLNCVYASIRITSTFARTSHSFVIY